MRGKLLNLSRNTKRAIMLSADLLLLPLSMWLAVALRYSDTGAAIADKDLLVFSLTTLISVFIFWRIGLYRMIVRYMGRQAVFAVLSAVTLSAVSLMILSFMFGERASGEFIPRSTPLIYWFVSLLMIGGSRFAIRAYFLTKLHSNKENVAIYGAGVSGAQLAAAIDQGNEYRPVVFIDDEKTAHNTVIHGVKVYHPSRLGELIEKYSISQVLLALPSVSHVRRREIIDSLEGFHVHVKTIPGVADIVTGNARIEEIRDVDVSDLLGRESVEPAQYLLSSCIENKTVLVTGSGGSIGSELCRQIIRFNPCKLLLLEMSEIALYSIERELSLVCASEKYSVDIIALLGNVRDKDYLRDVLTTYRIDTIYHAAAYKHVPIVEQNVREGVHNNVQGTRNLAELAVEHHVETFTLISTDKAVRPTNIMGATKRLAELVLQGLAGNSVNTRFCIVRFGNVLGSSGSVVPLFRSQIQYGGPVTVTHPDVTRYFMTIPEAAQLVLQASSMGKGGDVFVLDMGEPVLIADLARRMIRLMGCEVKDEDHPDGDINIIYTGLRPGEKLHEELLIGGNVEGTVHPRIMRAMEFKMSWDEIGKLLDQVLQAADESNHAGIKALLSRPEIGYKAADDVHDIIYCEKAGRGVLPSNVVPLLTGSDKSA